MPFANAIELSDLTPSSGVQITLPGTRGLGVSITALGDMNGDGFVDLLVGSNRENLYNGAAYVIFGGPSLSNGLSGVALDGTNGFRLSNGGRNTGGTVISGDVNGDGLTDLIIGADTGGRTNVVFGHTGPWAASLDLAQLNGGDGFRALGTGFAGYSLASGGDVNGDGIDDIVIGAIDANNAGAASGSVYVLFGKASGWAAAPSLAALNGADGFRLDGVDASDAAGASVGLADINNDGFADVLVGARSADPGALSSAGSAYVVFGKASGWAATQSLADLDGANGFTMTSGQQNALLGASVSSVGDVNGDGLEDLAVGASGTSELYVVFGREGAWGADLDLGSLDGTTGTLLTGSGGLGSRLAPAGDVNNDGFDDLIVAAPITAGHGVSTGSAVVLFGRQTWAASQSVASLTGAQTGFVLVGESANDQAGRSVGAAGDMNGDGIDDLLIGAWGNNEGGAGAGTAYVVYGVQGNVTRLGTAADETLIGNIADDTLSGLAGRDTLNGLAGNDTLNGGDNGDLLNGGDGADILNGDAGGDVLNGGLGADTLNGGSEADKLNGEDGDDALLGGDGNDQLFGGAGIDTLTGGAGADTLDGGGQADILVGGADNDIYIVNNAGVTINELAGGGYDIVRSSVSLTLAAEVEALQLQGSGDLNGTGNALANNLQGGSGNNILSGGAGVDTINGNDGNDRIIGGEGNDLMRGGLGADVFAVSHVFGSVLETDQIHDFSDAEGDYIDLSGVFAGVISEVAAFTRTSGEMTLSFGGGVTTLRLDVNGDGKADYQLKINGDVTDHATAWML